jgi:3-oxoadipate enol-lactonase
LGPLLLLHGIGTGPGGWSPQAEALESRREVLVPDLVRAYRRGWREAVDAVSELVAARAPVDVCGLSLGALAALTVAASRPQDVRRLAVCAGFAELPRGVRARVRAIAVAARLVPTGFLHRQLVADLREPHRSRALAEIASLRPREISRLMREAAGVRVDPARVVAPTLVLYGERDRANAPLARELAAALPAATLKEVPGAGHVANLDEPAAFTALLAEFCERPG